MSTRWYCCERCKEVDSYAIDEHSGDTTLPRGHFMVCGQRYDAMVTGFKSKVEAIAWLADKGIEVKS